MRATRTIASATAAVLSLSASLAPAAAEDLVTFDSIASRRYQTPFSRAHGEAPVVIPATPIQGYLSKHSGAGPFPAVVLLHSCNGLSPTRRAFAETIVSWGYVALFVDDFTTRGIRQVCKPKPGDTALGEEVQDALGGLLYVSRLAFVDPKRLAVIGFSHGGNTALQIASNRLPQFADDVRAPMPRAVVSFYPGCAAANRLAIPALVLIGSRDDWTPATACEQLLARHVPDSAELKLVVYPGAYHAFDNPEPARQLFGHQLQHDADAASRAAAETRAFLARHLGTN